MIKNLIRIHHQNYRDDLDFWISMTSDQDPVLELGCGYGRVMVPLIRSGRRVMGVDLDFEYLKFLQASIGIQYSLFFQADIRQIPLVDKIGAIIIPCNTYSTFSKSERCQLLSEIKRLLRGDGIFLVSLPNPVNIQELHQDISKVDGNNPQEYEDKIIHPQSGFPVQVSSSLDPLPNKLRWNWFYDHLLPDGSVERYSQAVDHYLSSLEQYLSEFEDAGLVGGDFWGDFDCSPYRKKSPFLILSASPA